MANRKYRYLVPVGYYTHESDARRRTPLLPARYAFLNRMAFQPLSRRAQENKIQLFGGMAEPNEEPRDTLYRTSGGAIWTTPEFGAQTILESRTGKPVLIAVTEESEVYAFQIRVTSKTVRHLAGQIWSGVLYPVEASILAGLPEGEFVTSEMKQYALAALARLPEDPMRGVSDAC